MSSEHQRQEHATHYAEALRERFETQGMLAELAEYPNFVVWRYSVIDGQRKKTEKKTTVLSLTNNIRTSKLR